MSEENTEKSTAVTRANAEKKLTHGDWDIRVRERNLRNGRIDEKDVEKHKEGLPDLSELAEPVSLSQPALGGRED